MTEKSYDTPCGSIHYWVSRAVEKAYTLVFLPGLTADHRLFERQLAYFAPRCPVLVWDAPGHGRSWPFRLDFTLMEKARWLEEILQREALPPPVLVGQSMGGYVAQAFMQQFPGRAKGFVSIDSAPLQRQYVTGAELYLLQRMEPVYRWYPWPLLVWQRGVRGLSVWPGADASNDGCLYRGSAPICGIGRPWIQDAGPGDGGRPALSHRLPGAAALRPEGSGGFHPAI